MKVRLVLSGCPPAGNPNRTRLIRLLASATWLEQAEIEARMQASPPWLLEADDRDEADAFAALIERVPGVRVTAVPAVGAPVPSLRPALERLESALAAPPEPTRPPVPPTDPAPTTDPVNAVSGTPAAREGDLVLDWSRRGTTGRHSNITERARSLAPPAPLLPTSGGLSALTAAPGLRRALALLVGLGLAIGAALAWHRLSRDADVRDDGIVTVLDPGSEPRSVLRYQPSAGHRATRKVAMHLAHVGRAPADLPTSHGVEGTLVIDVLRADDAIIATDYRVSFRYTRDGGPTRARRLQGRVRLTTTGVPGPDPAPTADALPADAQALGVAFVQLARAPLVKLPRESVGRGARWTWRLAEDLSPFGVPVTFEAQLTDSKGFEHALALTVRLDPPTHDTSWGPLGDLLPGAGIRSVEGRGRGRARLRADDTTLASVELEVALDIESAAGRFASRLTLAVE